MKFLIAAAKWLLPCAAATAIAGLLAGLVEAAANGCGLVEILVACGFALMSFGLPLFGLAVVAMLVLRRWQVLITGFREADGSMPRFAALIITGAAAVVVAPAAAVQSIWLVFRTTQFGPVVVAIGVAIGMTLAVLFGLLLGPVVYSAVAKFTSALERRWQRRFVRLFTLRRIAVALALAVVVAALLLWKLVVRKFIGHIDASLFLYPGVAVLGLVLAGFALRALRAYRIKASGLAVAIAAATIVFANVAIGQLPTRVLAVWAKCPLAGFAIDRRIDVETIRADLVLEGVTPTRKPGATQQDIVLITIDTLRADRTSPYGGALTTPTMASVAERGVVFDWAFAPGNVTRRSIPAMLTGLHPISVVGRVTGWALKLDPRHVTFVERLRAGGYRTAAFVCCKSFWGSPENTGLGRGVEDLVIDYSADRLAKESLQWFQNQQPDGPPRFAWLHLIEVHNWAGGDTMAPMERPSLYSHTVSRLDASLAPLVAGLDKLERKPVIIITSDHGEGLGEHGIPFHGAGLYNSQTRIPLIVAGPTVANGRVTQPVSLIDLAPTILELAGFAIPAGASGFDGHSILPLLNSPSSQDINGGFAFAATIADRSTGGGEQMVVRGQWKYYKRGDARELYNFRSDPGETKNLALTEPAIAADLAALLAATVSAQRSF